MSRPGTHPRIGELEDRFELLVDLLRQLKWVVCLERLVQLCQLHAIRLSAFANAFQWRLRWLIDAPQARANACLLSSNAHVDRPTLAQPDSTGALSAVVLVSFALPPLRRAVECSSGSERRRLLKLSQAKFAFRRTIIRGERADIEH